MNQALGGIPITINSARTRPYLRYELLHMPASRTAKVTSGVAGRQLPAGYGTAAAGMRFVMRFSSEDVELIAELTPTALSSMIKLRIAQYNSMAGTPISADLGWENDSDRWSLWPVSSVQGAEVVSLQDNTVYIAASTPITSAILALLPAGAVQLQLLPTGNTAYDGTAFNVQLFSVVEVPK